jgi:uncharacterized protein (TIGR00369 family)
LPRENQNNENFNDITGLEFIGLRDNRYVVTLDIEPRHHNVMGAVHGGVLCTLLDTTMARAYFHSLPEETRKGATLEMKVNFLKGVTGGRLTAYGQLIHSTRRTAYVEGYIENETDQIVARASATLMLFEPRNN